MSGELRTEKLRQRVNVATPKGVARIPKRLYAPSMSQQKIIQRGLSEASQSEAATQAAHEAIAKMAARAEAATPATPVGVARFGRAARIAAGMGQTTFARVGGLAGRAARIAASTEGGVAMASAGLVYGMGGHLLEEYQHKKADKKLRTGGYQEISGEGVKVVHTDPSEAARYTEASLSLGTHRVSHQHGQTKFAETKVAEAEPPPQQTKFAQTKFAQTKVAEAEPPLTGGTPVANLTPVTSEALRIASTPSRFEIAQQPIHHFRISRTQPYSLIDWERGARAKATLLGGSRM